MTDYQMLVLDIDDTLMTSENTISDATYQALMKAQEQGKKVVLASGRPTPSMIETAKQLKLDHFDSYIISFNGAAITSMANGQELFSQRLETDAQDDIVQYIQAKGLTVLTYLDDYVVMDKSNDYSHIESQLTGIPDRYDPEAIANLSQLAKARMKFIGVGDPDLVAAADAELEGRFGELTYATTSKPYFLEFVHHQVSKGQAIKVLCQHLGLTLDQVIACGDGNNDLTMIETAGLGVAMANATPLLKEEADHITLSNDQDGLVPIIRDFMGVSL